MVRFLIMTMVMAMLDESYGGSIERASRYLQDNQPIRAFREIRDVDSRNRVPVLWTKAVAALQANRAVEMDRSIRINGSDDDYLYHAHENLKRTLELVPKDKRHSVLELLSYTSRRMGQYREAFQYIKELVHLRNGDIDSQILDALGSIAEKDPSFEMENFLIEICSRRFEMESAELLVYVLATRIVLGEPHSSYKLWSSWAQRLYNNETIDVPSFRIPKRSKILSNEPIVLFLDNVFSETFVETLEKYSKENLISLQSRQAVPTCYIDIPPSIRRSHRWYQVGRWMCTDSIVETSHSRSNFVQHGDGEEITRLREHVLERFETLFGLPSSHAYPTQLLAYEDDALYGPHTDCSFRRGDVDHDRVFIVLLYLNENQASTKFSHLNVEVKPIKGRVVMFSSTNKRGFCDPRSVHESIHLEDGQKLVLQQWYSRHSIQDSEHNRRHIQMSVLTQEFPSGYVSCDGRGCRSYVPLQESTFLREDL